MSYGTPPPGHGQLTFGPPPVPSYPYSSWGRRVGAYFIDTALQFLLVIPAYVGIAMIFIGFDSTIDEQGVVDYDITTTSVVGIVMAIVFMLGGIGFQIWNRVIRQGRTGYSIGKGVLGIKLVKEATGEPTGGWLCFGRELVHVVDSASYVGYLWPLWDTKRQTFADMIVSTVVIDAPKS